MTRRALVLVALAFLSAGCKEGEPGSPTAPPTASARPPEPTAPRCLVDPVAVPPLPSFDGEAEPGARERPRLRVEPIEGPAVARCVPIDELVAGHATEGPTVGALRGEGEARSFALHRVRDVALLGDTGFLLSAGDAGLFLHDVGTLARRARLLDAPASAVAVAPDGATAAALLERPRVEGGEAKRHTLIVFDAWALTVLEEVERAPGGRLRFSPDGKTLLLASEERALWAFDVERRSVVRRDMDEPVADAAFVPDRPGVVAIVGDPNEVRFHDLANDRSVAQSGAARLRTRRDLNAVAILPGGVLVAGGDDDRIHVYRGMLGERAVEIASVELDGNVVEIAGRPEDTRYAVGTSRGSIAWFDGAERVASTPPLVPALLGDPIRMALRGDEIVAAFLGQLFRWPGGGTVAAAPCASGVVVASEASTDDVLVVLRVGANLAVHRVVGESRPEASTEEVGRLPWADATRIVRARDGSRAILGLDRDGVQVAFVDPGAGLTTAVGPGMELSARYDVREVEPGRFALWDREGIVYELDVPAKTWRLVGRVASPAPGMRVVHHPRRGYEARFEGTARRSAIEPAPSAPSP